MLIVTDLNVRYGMHEALTGVSLQVARDEIVVILGANGAGKSTLLSAIAGNCAGQLNGVISFDGESLTGIDAAKVVERGIAYVPEGRGVFADLSVEENLELGSYTEHARRHEQQSMQTVLSLFPKLEERKKQIVRTMSGGEQQMVAIGRALMSAPSILMLDEPSLGLSPLLCKELFSSLKQVRASGVGILLVEQNAKQSLGIADRGYLLGNGKIIGHDSAQQLLNDPNVQSAYLGVSNSAQPSRSAEAGKPKVTVISELVDGPEHSEDRPTQLLINPMQEQRRLHTVSADSLIPEDIDDMVARASSAASNQRDADATLPMQVVKLTNHQSVSANGRSSNNVATRSTSSVTSAMIHKTQHLSNTQDVEVQELLDEFEMAAQKASSGAVTNVDSGDNGAAQIRSTRAYLDDDLPLPQIPVYKKSPVKVYRRDGSGNLRKQD